MPSVYDCFVADGGATPFLQRKWALRRADGSVVEEVLGRLHFDLELNAKHLSFYIPGSPDHIEYPARILLDQIRELLSVPDHELQVASKVGSEVLKGDTLVFTGRVFVYCEQVLSGDRQQNIKADAAAHGYRLVFRSIDYANARA